MPDTILFLLLSFFLLSIALAIGIASFAFSDPRGFAKWFPISYWLSRVFDPQLRYALYWSYGIGVIALMIVIGLSFIFGSLTVTFGFGLWTSPILRWIEPQ